MILDIRQLWDNYLNLSVQIMPGYPFSQYQNITRINKYANSQFYSPKNGRAYFFYNVSSSRVKNFAKSIDLDVKNFKCKALNKSSDFPTFVTNKQFQKWAKENGFGLKLNEISTFLSQSGSIVLKVVKAGEKTTFEICDLMNLAFDPTVDFIKNASWVVERHILTKAQILAKKDVWNDVEEGLRIAEQVSPEAKSDKYDLVNTSLLPLSYVVWEFTGDKYVQESNSIQSKKVHIILVGDVVADGTGKTHVLLEENVMNDNVRYYDVHLSSYNRRWQRPGVVETLYPMQERMNALVTQNARAADIASTVLFSSATGNTQNLLEDLPSGSVVSDVSLQQIVMQNPGLTTFLQEYNQIQTIADQLCGTLATITGEDLPASQTYGQAKIQNFAASSTFEHIREYVAMQVSDILIQSVMPEIVKDWNKGGKIELNDPEDFQAYDESVANYEAVQAWQEGKISTMEEYEAYKALSLEAIGKKKREIEVPKGYFNFKIGIDVDPTDESTDSVSDFNNEQQLIVQSSQDPTIVDNPLFQKAARRMGVSLHDLQEYGKKKQKQAEKQMQAQKVNAAQISQQNNADATQIVR